MKTVKLFNIFCCLLSLAICSQTYAAQGPTKILAFGDFGTGDMHQKHTAQAMNAYCKEKGCDFAVTVGDNIYPRGVENFLHGKVDFDQGTPNYDLITRVFVSNYKDLNIPIYVSFGNHDVGNEGLISIFKDLFTNSDSINKRTVALMTNQINFTNHQSNPNVPNSFGAPSKLWTFPAPFYYVPEKNNVHLWAINTNTYPHRALDANNKLNISNPKNHEQEQWLRQSLSTTKDGWKIVFGHMPLFSHGNHGWKDILQIKEFRGSILNLLCQQKVDFYLTGHDHHLEVDRHVCDNGHVLTQILTGAAAKTDRVYARSFPFFSDDPNLLWANGKHYQGSKLIYKNDDYVLGFTHIEINDEQNARIVMKLTTGSSPERKDGCFSVVKGKQISKTACP
jgi:tartrate-resistant acid phosphatase type 5